MDAAAHCGAGRVQRRDGLHPRGDMVRGKDFLRGVPADVDKMDFPPIENRPGAYTGMEIPDAAVAAGINDYDRNEGVRSGVLILGTRY